VNGTAHTILGVAQLGTGSGRASSLSAVDLLVTQNSGEVALELLAVGLVGAVDGESVSTAGRVVHVGD